MKKESDIFDLIKQRKDIGFFSLSILRSIVIHGFLRACCFFVFGFVAQLYEEVSPCANHFFLLLLLRLRDVHARKRRCRSALQRRLQPLTRRAGWLWAALPTDFALPAAIFPIRARGTDLNEVPRFFVSVVQWGNGTRTTHGN